MGRIGFIQDYLYMYLPFKDFLIKNVSGEFSEIGP